MTSGKSNILSPKVYNMVTGKSSIYGVKALKHDLGEVKYI